MLGLYAILDDEDDEDEDEVVPQVPRRLFRTRIDLLDYRDKDLIRLYRFPRNIILDMCTLVRDDLERETNRNRPIPVNTQVLASLRFLASGSFQNIIAEICGFSQPTMSRIIAMFLNSMVNKIRQFIYFSVDNPEWVANAKQIFETIAGIPNILCITDGTHIYMKNPKNEPYVFINRKGRPSINAQLSTGPLNQVVDLNVRFPGSTHDSHIWAHCGLREILLNLNFEGYSLGDMGYPLEPRMITPYRGNGEDELTAEQMDFNLRHSRTRIRVEHVIGLVKMCFRAVDDSGGELQYEPEKVCQIFAVCCMLHNVRMRHAIPLPIEALGVEVQVHNDNEGMVDAEDLGDGIDIRNQILQYLHNNV